MCQPNDFDDSFPIDHLTPDELSGEWIPSESFADQPFETELSAEEAAFTPYPDHESKPIRVNPPIPPGGRANMGGRGPKHRSGRR